MAKNELTRLEVINLNEFTRELKKLTADPKGPEQFKKANEVVAERIIREAYKTADTPMRKRAAETLRPAKSNQGIYVIGGSNAFPFFGGANFGSNHDVLRLIKARRTRGANKGTRARATTVRREEEWKLDKIVRRVESQYVSRSGKTISAREAGSNKKLYQVKLARTSSGAVRTIRGWNQFGEWTKGKDFFLYKAINQNYDELAEFYIETMKKAAKDAFPD